jgi:tRNA dimethylallyltransferase
MQEIQTNKTVIFLMGPTASGKTELAVQLSQKIKSRLISVDSALIYKNMNIGSAKPDRQTLQKAPHYLIDICEPEQTYSAFDFVRDAKAQIELAFNNNQVPILVGGTSFYFNALQHGLSNLPASTLDSRIKVEKLLDELGCMGLHRRLAGIDKISAKRIHPNDVQRVSRAIEVFEVSGKSLSELQGNKQGKLKYPIKKIVLMPPRSLLHQRIEARFDKMLDMGFLDEVRQLRKNPKLNESLPSIRCVGYRQAWQYLNQEISHKEMIEKAVIKTRQLCKHQSTWLKAEKERLLLTNIEVEKVLAYLYQ